MWMRVFGLPRPQESEDLLCSQDRCSSREQCSRYNCNGDRRLEQRQVVPKRNPDGSERRRGVNGTTGVGQVTGFRVLSRFRDPHLAECMRRRLESSD